MRGALGSTLYTLAATAVCVSIGARHGVIEVRTERIRDETTRALCAGTLRGERRGGGPGVRARDEDREGVGVEKVIERGARRWGFGRRAGDARCGC